MSSEKDRFTDESFAVDHGIEEPYVEPSDLEEIHDRFDTFEHYLDHLHKRLDYLEDQIDEANRREEDVILEELERQKSEIIQDTQDQIDDFEQNIFDETQDIRYELDQLNELLVELEYSERDTLESEIESLEYDLDEVFNSLGEIKEEQITSSEITRRIDVGLHIPLLAAGGVASAAVGVGFLIGGSILSIPLVVLSAFLIYTAKRISQKHNIKLSETI